MKKNKYLEKLASVAGFFSAHFRIIVFMCFIVFLFYIAMLGIEIVSVIDHVPSMEDINKKIQSVSIRKDLIKKIDNFILIRREGANEQLFEKNPFLPYQKGTSNSSGNEPVITPDISTASPTVSPNASLPEALP